VAEAGVTLTSVGVQDPEGRSTTRWAGPVAGDDHLRSLADHVPAEADPRSTGELEPDAGRLADGGFEAVRADVRRLEHDERDAGPAREGGQAPEPVGNLRRVRRAGGQVDDQHVDRSTGQQRAGHRQALLGIGRGQHDEPLRLDPPRHDLDRVQRGGEVQPGDDRAGRLCRRREPQGERRAAARQVAPQCHARPPRHAAGAEDGIELGEAGGEDAIEIDGGTWSEVVLRYLDRDGCERAHDFETVAGERGRRRAPARSKGRQCRAQVGGGSAHLPTSIEQMFE
jgi:hypothetical protein